MHDDFIQTMNRICTPIEDYGKKRIVKQVGKNVAMNATIANDHRDDTNPDDAHDYDGYEYSSMSSISSSCNSGNIRVIGFSTTNNIWSDPSSFLYSCIVMFP